jgi:hypothetical protein
MEGHAWHIVANESKSMLIRISVPKGKTSTTKAKIGRDLKWAVVGWVSRNIGSCAGSESYCPCQKVNACADNNLYYHVLWPEHALGKEVTRSILTSSPPTLKQTL